MVLGLYVEMSVTVALSLFLLFSPLSVSQANRPPAKLNLLTCQVKHNPEEKKSFDLISRTVTPVTVTSHTHIYKSDMGAL